MSARGVAARHRRPLVSHTLDLGGEPELDPLSLAGHDGTFVGSEDLALVGWGTALDLPLTGGLIDTGARRTLTRLLGAVATRDDVIQPGTGPLALGALPFDRSAPARLSIPGTLVGSAGRDRWITVTSENPERPSQKEVRRILQERRSEVGLATAARPRDPLARQSPTGHRVRAHPEPERFVDAVTGALACIRSGGLAKVVLARYVDVDCPWPPEPLALLRGLRSREPASTAFVLPVPGGHFLGASPELIVSRRGRSVVSHPLAGTVALGHHAGLSPSDRLLGSAKDLEEHRLVVEAVGTNLQRHCEQLIVPDHPGVVQLGSDARLSTRICGCLAAAHGRPPGALDLLAELHPTPAVGGVPRDAALELITATERSSRGHWAGPVGWTDRTGDGDWVLGIRSVTIEGTAARAWAGVGIVAASNPEAELAETELKLEPVLAAIEESSATGARG